MESKQEFDREAYLEESPDCKYFLHADYADDRKGLFHFSRKSILKTYWDLLVCSAENG